MSKQKHPFPVTKAKVFVKRLDPAITMKGFETKAETVHRACQSIAVLRKGGREHQALAEKLNGCRSRQRCSSGACPACMRRYRRWFASEAQNALSDFNSSFAISVIPTHFAVPIGNLNTVDPAGPNNWLRTIIKRAGLGAHPIIGGWDISLNEGTDGARWWQLHFYGIAFNVSDPGLFSAALRSQLQANEKVLRPLKVRPANDLAESSTYSLKAIFVRRVSYIGNNGRRQTRTLSLKPDGQRELLTYLDSMVISNRIFLRGFRRVGSRLRAIATVSERPAWKA